MIRLLVLAALTAAAMPAAAQIATSPGATVGSDTAPGSPVVHRLTPDEIAAAQADGAERNRAAELLAMQRGDPGLALPGEKRKRAVHGEAGFGVGTGGAREVFGSATTDFGNGTSATVAGDYQQFGRIRRP